MKSYKQRRRSMVVTLKGNNIMAFMPAADFLPGEYGTLNHLLPLWREEDGWIPGNSTGFQTSTGSVWSKWIWRRNAGLGGQKFSGLIQDKITFSACNSGDLCGQRFHKGTGRTQPFPWMAASMWALVGTCWSVCSRGQSHCGDFGCFCILLVIMFTWLFSKRDMLLLSLGNTKEMFLKWKQFFPSRPAASHIVSSCGPWAFPQPCILVMAMLQMQICLKTHSSLPVSQCS